MQTKILCPVCAAGDFYTLLTARGNRRVLFISQEHPVVLCKNCGICFLNSQIREKDYQRYYEWYDRPMNRKVDARGFRPGKRTEYDRLRLNFFVNFVKDKNSKIIDIGSGYGNFMKNLQNRGYMDLYGIEPNREAVRVAQANFGFKIYNANLGDASLPKNEFDAATLIAVIEHFNNSIEALRNIYKLLKPRGYLYVNTPNLLDVVLRQGIDKYFKFVHTFYFTEKSLSNCLKKAGFEIVGSYTLPADRRFSSLLCPENYSNSELNIIARKPLKEGGLMPVEKEN
jgi:2-polyprenyl-3-methyl-5-hydroxy-6-metoxy-1,4-benzoquinol methylase